MTRFARAKGSKASNLKYPEDSTPWEVMKEQLLKSKKENEESKNREEVKSIPTPIQFIPSNMTHFFLILTLFP